MLQRTTLILAILGAVAGATSHAKAADWAVEGFRQGGTPAVQAAVSRTGALQLAAIPLATPAVLPGSATPQGRISCVPYARQITGMAIRGNGWQWWGHAAGRYARDQRPEHGSVLAFRAASYMPMGHVAVVSRVYGGRHLLIDHANWGGPGIRKGSVMRGISVVDVSPGNDWTEVRVQSGRTPGAYGRVYATYGFIHNRPTDERTLEAGRAAPRRDYTELAEAAEPTGRQSGH